VLPAGIVGRDGRSPALNQPEQARADLVFLERILGALEIEASEACVPFIPHIRLRLSPNFVWCQVRGAMLIPVRRPRRRAGRLDHQGERQLAACQFRRGGSRRDPRHSRTVKPYPAREDLGTNGASPTHGLGYDAARSVRPPGLDRPRNTASLQQRRDWNWKPSVGSFGATLADQVRRRRR